MMNIKTKVIAGVVVGVIGVASVVVGKAVKDKKKKETVVNDLVDESAVDFVEETDAKESTEEAVEEETFFEEVVDGISEDEVDVEDFVEVTTVNETDDTHVNDEKEKMHAFILMEERTFLNHKMGELETLMEKVKKMKTDVENDDVDLNDDMNELMNEVQENMDKYQKRIAEIDTMMANNGNAN